MAIVDQLVKPELQAKAREQVNISLAHVNKYADRHKLSKRIASIELAFNGRLKKSAGRAWAEVSEGKGYIEISPHFFAYNVNAMIYVIIPHEVCHIADASFYGEMEREKEGHGLRWAALMGWCGLKPERYHSLTYPK